jgi:hypothetical protein
MSAYAGAPDPERVRTTVNQVLAEPEFARNNGITPGLLEWLASWLERTLHRVGHTLRDLPEWALWLILVWLALTLLAIVIHAIYVLLGLSGRLGRVGWLPRGTAQIRDLQGIPELDYDHIRLECERALAAGDWERVVRLSYAAAILWLDRVGHVRFLPCKTNRDYMSELSAEPKAAALGAIFERMTGVFERIVYGVLESDALLGKRMMNELEGLYRESTEARAG